VATEFDPRDEDVDLGAEQEPEDEPFEGEDDSIEFARDADGTPSLAGRGSRGLSISGIGSDGPSTRGKLSLSQSKGGGVLDGEFGTDLEPLAPLDDEEEPGGGDEDDLAPADPTLDDGPVDDFQLGGDEEEDVVRDDGFSLGHDDESALAPAAAPAAAAPAARKAAKLRKAKKRRLVVDEVTVLSRSVLKANLADTSDIVRMAVPPRLRTRGFGAPAKKLPTLEERMHMPNTPGLAPELLEMFSWTMRADPLPFRLRKGYNYAGPINKKARLAASSSAAAAAAPEEEEEAGEEEERALSDDEAEEVEVARNASPEKLSAGGALPEDEGFDFQGDEEEPLEDDEPAPFDEEELGGAAPSYGDLKADASGGGSSFLADAGKFELGAVNDIEADENFDETKSQASGADDETGSVTGGDDTGDAKTARSAAQWHPHTKKVMSMLQHQLESKDKVSYNGISGVTRGARVGRRTAAGVFFEMLQLKTWDYIEVNQDGPYGDIQVTKAAKFDHGIPGARGLLASP